MNYENKLFLLLLLSLIIGSFSQLIKKKEFPNNLKENNYYASALEDEIINISFDF
jgi:hypothetical protein